MPIDSDIEPRISENALTVLERRYLKKDEEGTVIETPRGMFERVAQNIAQTDKNYDEDADVNVSYDLGAHSFIRKPVDHARFAHAVQQTTQYWLGLNESLSDEPSRRMSAPR